MYLYLEKKRLLKNDTYWDWGDSLVRKPLAQQALGFELVPQRQLTKLNVAGHGT